MITSTLGCIGKFEISLLQIYGWKVNEYKIFEVYTEKKKKVFVVFMSLYKWNSSYSHLNIIIIVDCMDKFAIFLKILSLNWPWTINILTLRNAGSCIGNSLNNRFSYTWTEFINVLNFVLCFVIPFPDSFILSLYSSGIDSVM